MNRFVWVILFLSKKMQVIAGDLSGMLMKAG